MVYSRQVTPTAKRNSYRVAKGAYHQPQALLTFTPRVRKKAKIKALSLPYPQGERESPKRLKHSKKELTPLGEGWGGASSVWSPPKKAQTFPIPFGEAGEVWATDKSQADYSAIVIHLRHTSCRAGRGWAWSCRLCRQPLPCFHRYLRAGCAWLPHVCALTGVLHNYVSLSYSLFTYLLITLTASVVSIFPSPLTSAVALLSLSVIPLI